MICEIRNIFGNIYRRSALICEFIFAKSLGFCQRKTIDDKGILIPVCLVRIICIKVVIFAVVCGVRCPYPVFACRPLPFVYVLYYSIVVASERPVTIIIGRGKTAFHIGKGRGRTVLLPGIYGVINPILNRNIFQLIFRRIYLPLDKIIFRRPVLPHIVTGAGKSESNIICTCIHLYRVVRSIGIYSRFKCIIINDFGSL